MSGASSAATAASFLRATAAERVAERAAVRDTRRAEEPSVREAREARDVPAGFAAALQPPAQRERPAAPTGPETELDGDAGEHASGSDSSAAASDARGGAAGEATASAAEAGAPGAVSEIGGAARSASATEEAGAWAANAAASAAPAAGAVVRDMDALAPEFRGRLGRVMSRMRSEFGHDVRVVETLRTQARQDRLHAQGRTDPGPVVTWTRHSKHGDGLAADLMVDGRWDNPAGYARLQQVAREEGLHTLGARGRARRACAALPRAPPAAAVRSRRDCPSGHPP